MLNVQAAAAAILLAVAAPSAPQDEGDRVKVRGRTVCIDGEMVALQIMVPEGAEAGAVLTLHRPENGWCRAAGPATKPKQET